MRCPSDAPEVVDARWGRPQCWPELPANLRASYGDTDMLEY